MLPLLLCIEIFSFIIRMFSLAIRLVANIMAGHTLIYIIASFSLLIFNLNYFLLVIGVGFICTIMLLELGVACLQAYVFTYWFLFILTIYLVVVINYLSHKTNKAYNYFSNNHILNIYDYSKNINEFVLYKENLLH